MKRPRSFLFTSRHQSMPALVSCLLGLISLVSTALMIFETYENGGVAQVRCGAVVFICLIFSLAGLILAIYSFSDQDSYLITSVLGVIFNGVVLTVCFVLMYLGMLV
ncbi:MAG: hypothetical protein SOI60_03255 [Lachnospiraceae bacterium]